MNVAQKLIASHLLNGDMKVGEEIAPKVDQTLTQDATGTMVMLELEAMQVDRVKTELSVQYVDHNLLQEDFKNPDDHLFLQSACQRFGIWFSRPGNGVSHPLHQERFGVPGKTLLGLRQPHLRRRRDRHARHRRGRTRSRDWRWPVCHFMSRCRRFGASS